LSGPVVKAASVSASSTFVTDTSSSLLDVNGDGAVTPNDVNAIINVLNPTPPSVSITLGTTDLNGTPISTIAVGQDFKVTATVNDLRVSNPQGVFAAYVDATYDAALSSIPSGGKVVFDPFYSNGKSQNLSTAGQINETGSFGQTSAPGLQDPPQPIQHLQWSL